MDDVRAWPQRPLEDVYPVIFLDALVLKIREGGSVQRRACYLALGVTLDGDRDVLGLWFQETEGAKFWMQVLTELKHRGVCRHPDLLRGRAQGLPGGDRGDLPEDHGADVHRAPDPPQPEIRARAASATQVARDLKPIYTAIDADAAQQALERFDEKWGQRFPVITQAWLNAWEYVTPFLAFPPGGPPRDLHHERDRGAQPPAAQSDQDQRTLPQRGRRPQADLPRALNAVPAWTRTRNWTAALLAFKIHFGDRLPD